VTEGENRRQAIAVIGASNDRRKFGNKCVRAYRQAGWTVYPVNLRNGRIEGLQAFARLSDLADPVDRISVYLPPHITYRILDELPKGIEVYFNPGSADSEVLEEARRRGIKVRDACAIVAVGLSPAQL
jgi:predicted CoA-binding protein